MVSSRSPLEPEKWSSPEVETGIDGCDTLWVSAPARAGSLDDGVCSDGGVGTEQFKEGIGVLSLAIEAVECPDVPIARDEDDSGDSFGEHPFQEVVSLCTKIVPALATSREVNDHAISVGDYFERRCTRLQGCF